MFFRVACCCLFVLSGCSGAGRSSGPDPQPANSEVPAATAKARLSEVKIGMSQAQVEALVGAPMSIREQLSPDPRVPGTEVVATYFPGMAEMMNSMRSQMAASSGVSTASSIAGSAMGLAGLAGPAGGIAAGVGSSILGMAGSLAAPDAEDVMPEPEEMEMLIVTYRNGQVVSTERMNPAGGIPMQPQPLSEG